MLCLAAAAADQAVDLYLYSKTSDLSYAATSLADLNSLIAALANPGTAANSATISRVVNSLPALGQGDTAEPLSIYSYDAAGTVSPWVYDPTVSLAVGLGDADPRGAFAYASTTAFSIVGGNHRDGTLSLATTALRDAVSLALRPGFGARVAGVGAQFILHLRKRTADGATETLARIPVQVLPGVLEADPVDTPAPAADYLTSSASYAAFCHNLTAITSLTGGGAGALDGVATASSTRYPVGVVVLLSYGLVTQWWKLVAGTDAEDVSATPAVVRPDDYNASTNAVVWKQIG